jgi:tetratricopeptide (TPR) repeat protein
MAVAHDYVGKFFGNYGVITELTQGLYSSIFLARHRFLPRRVVAIKILHTNRLTFAEKQAQFLQEARILDRLTHPHILPLVDVGIEHDSPYLMTEYAPHGSLRERLERQMHCPLPLDETLSLLSQIGNALQYAHDQDILHCDLKPENILFNRKGDVWLADFGTAAIMQQADTTPSSAFGTVVYMAPEQVGGVVSKESDQYALGCIAYELFTGQQPFFAFSLQDMMQKQVLQEPMAPRTINPTLPPQIEAAILKALAKKRAERFEDIRTFLAALASSPFPREAVPIRLASVSAPPVQMVQAKTKEQWIDEALALFHGKSIEASLLAYGHALELDPEDAYIHVGKGLVLCELKQYEEALAVVEQAIQLDPGDSYAYLAKGRTLRIAGRYQEALEMYEYAIQLDPNDGEAYLGKGLTLEQIHRYQDALSAYKEAVICDPRSITAWQNKANALKRLGFLEEAREAYEKAEQLIALVDIQSYLASEEPMANC